MRVEIEADLVIALKEDLLAEAGSQVIIIDGEIVGVIPPRRSRKLVQAVYEPPPPQTHVGGAIHKTPRVAQEAVDSMSVLHRRGEHETPPVAQEPVPAPPDTESLPAEDWELSDPPVKPGSIISQEDILRALKWRGFTVRQLTEAFEARGQHGSAKNVIARLRRAGLVKPLDDRRFPKYGLITDAGETASALAELAAARKAHAASEARKDDRHPVRPLTQQMILDTLEEPKALSMASIAKELHIEPKSAGWSRLSGFVGSMVKFGTLKKVEDGGMMLLGLPEHHQAT